MSLAAWNSAGNARIEETDDAGIDRRVGTEVPVAAPVDAADPSSEGRGDGISVRIPVLISPPLAPYMSASPGEPDGILSLDCPLAETISTALSTLRPDEIPTLARTGHMGSPSSTHLCIAAERTPSFPAACNASCTAMSINVTPYGPQSESY